jgi:hypothetical protein
MEKRRRARINQYLDELKNFILVNEKDVSEISNNFYLSLAIAQNIDRNG